MADAMQGAKPKARLQASPGFATARRRSPTARAARYIEQEVRAAAATRRVKLALVLAANAQEIDTAFAFIADNRIGALVFTSEPFLNSRREQLVALAKRGRLPAVFASLEFATEGGLMSHCSDRYLALREWGVHTARAFGLTIPQTLQLQADKVIE